MIARVDGRVEDLTVADITVGRGGRTVLRGVSFSLAAGGALVLKGANGAGKSTLLRAIAGLLPLAAGRILRSGDDVADDPEGHRAGLMYVGHALGLKATLTVAENLAFWASVLAAPPDRVARAMDGFALGPLANLAVGRLSAGQQRRASLARLGLADAALWLLDEPTVSLDAAAVDRLTAVMADHRRQGGMIIAATHQDVGLADAQTLTLTPVSPWQEAAG